MADNSTIVPNPLSDYATSSYALTLYATDKQYFKNAALSLQSMGKRSLNVVGKKVIIAESAVTSIQITNLTLNTIPLETQGTVATNLNMSITQTRGTGLIDKLYAISSICGWENPYEMNYFLEIRFLGTTDNNDYNPTVEVVTIPIIFTSVNTNLSHNATVYNIEAVYSHALTNDYSYSRVPENMTISSGENVRTFFNNFANKMNEVEMRNVDNVNFSRPSFKHEFNTPLEFSNWTLGSPASTTTSRSNQTLYSYSPNSNEVTVSSNSTIQAFIDEILKYVQPIQDKLVDNDNFVETYVVEPLIMVDKFDVLSGKETYIITWNITKVIRRKYTNNNETRYENEAIDNLRTVKLYDYYHTGLNSEVREANFTINNLYHAKILQYQNLYQQNPNAMMISYLNSLSAISSRRQQDNIAYEDEIRIDDDGNEILYAEDIDVSNPNYFLYEPKVKSNPADLNNASINPDINKALQYKEDLDFIRNSTNYSFINCELKIKGDPYWVLPPTSIMTNGMTTENTRDSSVENAVLVRFNYPTNEYYGEDNRAVESDANVFTSFYYIRAVTSTFHNGKFEQTLTGYRETKVSLKRIKKYLIDKGII